MDNFVTVRPGDEITADIWNKLLAATNRSNINYGGENTRLTKTPHGTIVNAKNIGGYLHPWRVLASHKTASVYPGLINGATPTINDQPMTDIPAPMIELSSDKFHQGKGWIALELETDKDPKDDSDTPNMYVTIKTAKVVQCQMITGAERTSSTPLFYFGLPGIGFYKVRYPLARLHQVAGGSEVNVFQVAMFNLSWKAKPPNPSGAGTAATATGSAFPRHFFWPS